MGVPRLSLAENPVELVLRIHVRLLRICQILFVDFDPMNVDDCILYGNVP
jgi:hypothetical protein